MSAPSYSFTTLLDQPMVFVGYTHKDHDVRAHVAYEGLVEVDQLDGSGHDGDGTELQLCVHLSDDGLLLTWSSKPEDAARWDGLPGGAQAALEGYVALAEASLNSHPYELDVALAGAESGFVRQRQEVLDDHPDIVLPRKKAARSPA